MSADEAHRRRLLRLASPAPTRPASCYLRRGRRLPGRCSTSATARSAPLQRYVDLARHRRGAAQPPARRPLPRPAARSTSPARYRPGGAAPAGSRSTARPAARRASGPAPTARPTTGGLDRGVRLRRVDARAAIEVGPFAGDGRAGWPTRSRPTACGSSTAAGRWPTPATPAPCDDAGRAGPRTPTCCCARRRSSTAATTRPDLHLTGRRGRPSRDRAPASGGWSHPPAAVERPRGRRGGRARAAFDGSVELAGAADRRTTL